MSEEFVKVGQIADFPDGSLRKVSVNGEDILVVCLSGKLYAVANNCTHRGGPLNEGELEDGKVVCPWHGGQFDVTTGKVVTPPPMKDLTSLEVKIDGTDVLLKGK
jgi:nitrite reductase/ring-hydroxylating ferredoxin subunit